MQRWYIAAVPISLFTSWAAWRGPPPPEQHITPLAIPRSNTTEEKSALFEQANTLTMAIQKAEQLRGHPIEMKHLETADPKGVPYISEIIPDNPLMPNIASISEHCPSENVASTTDWVYCPSTGVIVPVINGQSVSGNE